MSSSKHTGTTIAWGTVIPASASSRNAIVRLPHWTGPAVLPEDGKFKPLPGVPSTLSALDLVQKEQAVYCTFPGCGPFVTIAQGSKRAAFRHPRGMTLGDHDNEPETLDHSESKSILLAWILRTCAVDRFDHDTSNLVLADSNGVSVQARPDAYIELADGARIAIEYQYSAGSGRQIREKTELYEQAGITVWWIFSGRSPYTLQMRPPVTLSNGRRGFPETDLTTTQLEMLQAGIPFVWFDREHQTIATPAGCTARLITTYQDELWPREDATDGTRQKGRPQTKKKYWGPLIKDFSTRACLIPSTLSECGIDTATGTLITGGTQMCDRGEAQAALEIGQLREEARARRRATEFQRRVLAEQAESEAQELAARAKEAERNAEREATEARRLASDISVVRAEETTTERTPEVAPSALIRESTSTSTPPKSMLDQPSPLREESPIAPPAGSTVPALEPPDRKGLRGIWRALLDIFR